MIEDNGRVSLDLDELFTSSGRLNLNQETPSVSL